MEVSTAVVYIWSVVDLLVALLLTVSRNMFTSSGLSTGTDGSLVAIVSVALCVVVDDLSWRSDLVQICAISAS